MFQIETFTADRVLEECEPTVDTSRRCQRITGQPWDPMWQKYL
jgi:hypothetical protein